MRIGLLLVIKLYWALFSKDKRRKCIFRTSCSQYVYQATKREGLFQGLSALKYRFQNCRSGSNIFVDPIDGRLFMILPDSSILPENEISERFSQLSNESKHL